MAKSIGERFNDIPPIAQFGIFAGIAVLIGAGLIYQFVIPKMKELALEVVKREMLSAENEKGRVVEQQLAEYENRIRQLTRQLQTLRRIVPDEDSQGAFMRDMIRAGAATGINIRSIVSRPRVQREFHFEVPYDLALDGTFYGLRNFMDALARQTRLVNVSALSLSGIQGGAAGAGRGKFTYRASETVGATCTVTTYYNRPRPAGQQGQQRPQGQAGGGR